MAPTSLYGAYDNGDRTGTAYPTTSLSPAANRLLLLAARGRASSVTIPKPTIGGTLGLTWVEVGDFLDDDAGATRSRVTLFAALTGGSPGSGTVTAQFGSTAMIGCHLHVVSFDDLDMSGTAADAVVGAAVTADAFSVDIGALADPANYGFAVFGSQANETLGTSDGTVLATAAGSTPTSATAVVYGVNNQTLAVSGTGGEPFAIGLELKAASVGVEATSAVSGGGQAEAVGTKGGVASSEVAGGGKVDETGVKGGVGASALSGGGTIDETGFKAAQSTSSLSGGGQLEAQGQQAVEGPSTSSSLSGGGAADAQGRKGALADTGATGGGAVAANGLKGAAGATILSGDGTLVSFAVKGGDGASILSGGGELHSLATGAHFGTSAITGGGHLTALIFAGILAQPPVTARTRTAPRSGRTKSSGGTGRTFAGAASGATGTSLEEGDP